MENSGSILGREGEWTITRRDWCGVLQDVLAQTLYMSWSNNLLGLKSKQQIPH